MKFAMYPPSRNLGCLGFRIGRLYFDFHECWTGWIGVQMFVSHPILIRLGLSKSGKGWLNQYGWRPMR